MIMPPSKKLNGHFVKLAKRWDGEMRNTVTNRVINFARSLEPKGWFTVVSGGYFDMLKEQERGRKAQQEVYAEAIGEVKRECDMVKNKYYLTVEPAALPRDFGISFILKQSRRPTRP